MLISGIQKFSLQDFPGKTSCIVFSAGCNFRCGFCHNPEFVLPEHLKKLSKNLIPEETFFRFLDKRKGLLDAVVISGGEPTIHADLEKFVCNIRDRSYLVKLDTNGSAPSVLKELMEKKLLDYVAMDVKTSMEHYKTFSGMSVDPSSILESINLLKNASIDYEFRITLIREIHSFEILEKISRLIDGAKRLYLQDFSPKHTLEPEYAKYRPFGAEEKKVIREMFQKKVSSVGWR